MAGPQIGINLIQSQLIDLDLSGGILFSLTLRQSGKTIGREQLDQLIDLKESPLISNDNFLYHLAPIMTFKVHPVIGITISPHYYFDQFSNISRTQPYTEQCLQECH